MAHNVIEEAKRCLNCKNPQCVKGCPISTPIPEFISTFLNGDINKAGQLLFDNNPLSVVCSLVCNHSSQCQGHCIKGIKGQPVEISTIENYISERYLDSLQLDQAPPNGIKVAVVGGGPAGITISIKMAQLGYDVTLFESKPKIGGVLRFGIPEFRLPKSIIDRFEKLMIKMGIKIKPNITIGKSFGVEELFRDGFKAISIGTGVTYPNNLNIKGETLAHVHYGVHYLKSPESYRLGNNLVIIGGGNVAMDVARTAMRQGVKNVTITVRSETYSATKEEADYAQIEGADFIYNITPIEITDNSVIFAKTITNADGSLQTTNETYEMNCDSVIICVSQKPSNLILRQTQGLEVNERGLAKISEDGVTSRPGIFASGDVVRGAKTVVEAVETSKKVAAAMDKYLKSLKN